MLEKSLIVVLAVLVLILASLIIVRVRRDRNLVKIKIGTVNDLIASMMKNIVDGRIQDVAGSVSDILKNHLMCEKIIFLKKKQNRFELNYFCGIRNFKRDDFGTDIPPSIQKRLKLYHQVNYLYRLKSMLNDSYLAHLEAFGFRYFFPVFIRDNLYGIYLIDTPLPANDNALNLLATTLAFNLSSAYHLGYQDYRIKKIQSQLTARKDSTTANANNIPGKRSDITLIGASGADEILRLLRIRNCRRLVEELLNSLRRKNIFSELAFIVQSNPATAKTIVSGWNYRPDLNKILSENYDLITRHLNSDTVIRPREFTGDNHDLNKTMKLIGENKIDHLMVADWGPHKKAIFAFNSVRDEKQMKRDLADFTAYALPFVENVRSFEKAEALSYTDGLTGLYNFRYFKQRLDEELHRAKRYRRYLALMIFDLDDLKVVNDKHGHLAGDALIKSFGNTLVQIVRSNDVVTRYGGDEFCVIMPDTNQSEAKQFVERIYERISTEDIYCQWAEKKLKYTVSMGGAVFPDDAGTAPELVHSADMALLKAKQTGRNRAILFNSDENR